MKGSTHAAARRIGARLPYSAVAVLAKALLVAGLWQGVSNAAVEPVDRVAAVVNAEVITLRELEARVRGVEMQLRRQNVQMPPPDVLRSQVLERMIVDRAQVQLAREQGLRIDDAQLDRAVAAVAAQNNLNVQELRARLEEDGMSFAAFRDTLRADMLIQRLREREVEQRVQISEADIDAFLQDQKDPSGGKVEYNLAHILIRIPEGASADQIAERRARAEGLLQQIQSGADFGQLAVANSDSPEGISGGGLGWREADRLPQLFVQAVSSLQPGQTTSLLRSPNGFHILKLVDRRAQGNQAALPGGPIMQTRARHILIRQTELVSEAEALRRLREIRERLEQKTASFADMARQYSVDGSAGNGGDLGWVYPGDTVPEFERAMNALQPGEISEPVRSPFGWHLIMVEQRRNDEASPERLRLLARQSIRERRADEAYQDWLRQLRDSTYVEYKLDQ